MQIINVIPLKTGIPKESLSYFTAHEVHIGDVVRVPINRRIVPAIVTDISNIEDQKINLKSAGFNLKKITEVLGPSLLRKEIFDTISELKEYYLTRAGTLITTLLPSFIFDDYEKLTQSREHDTIKSNLAQERLVYQAPIEDRFSYYKTYIRASFAKKQSVFITLPTIHELESVADILKKGIETYTFVLHSGLGSKELILLYNQIIDESHPILIIATPGFLALPRYDIHTIIIERENSSAYKTITRPYTDLRVVGELFSKKIGAKLILGDTLLRPETIWRHSQGEFTEVSPLVFRNENKIPTEIIDMRDKVEMLGREKDIALFSDEVKTTIDELKHKSGHIFLFTLKKGIASNTVCNDCKKVVQCPKCKVPLVLQTENGKKKIFACPTCKDVFDALSRCVTCGSWNLNAIGIGTERVSEQLEKLYPDLPIFRFDKESVKNESSAEKIITDFYTEKKAVLVGTELALFYLDQKVDYSVIISFDSLFAIPNFRIGEKIIGLASSLASVTEKKLFIQTRNPNEKILQNIVLGNFSEWHKREITLREQFNYPPFTTLIKVSVTGSPETLDRAKTYLADTFTQWSPAIIDAKSRVRGYETISMILKIPRLSWYPENLLPGSIYDNDLLLALKDLPANWSIVVDPYDLG